MYNKNLIFVAACLGMLLFGIVLITLGSILPAVVSHFALEPMAAGYLASLLPLGILAGSLFFGPIVDRYGYKQLLLLSSALVCLSMEGIAFATSILHLQLSIAGIGLAGGAINGGTNALVADISDEQKGARLSLLGVFFGLGALGMPVVLGALSQSASYDRVLAWVGIAVLVPAAFFLVIRFPLPKQPQGFPLAAGAAIIKQRPLLLCAAALFLESGLEGLVNNWTTTFLQQKALAVTADALFSLSCFVAGMTVTRLVLGWLLRRFTPYYVLFVSLTIAFAGSIVLMASTSLPLAVAGLILLGIGLAAGFPVILAYVGNLYPTITGTAFGIVLTVALTGNMLLNYTMGVIAQANGMQKLPLVLAVSLVVMTLVIGSGRNVFVERKSS